ncbi:MAG: outer membrane lipoprotein-sorting protein [Verrucomicrobia bacterium]|nr:outer membrane lipoprotein-sorting protein [Verrucomicrobiota bacterium]
MRKMVRQAVCFPLILTFLGPLSMGQDLTQPSVRLKAEKRDTSTWNSGVPENPTPRQMQNFLWRTLVMKDLILKGRVQSGEKKIPVVVRTRDRLIQFEFQDRPLQIRVRFAPEGSLIQKRSKPDAEWQVVTGDEKTRQVAGTDLAYEDLGIDFLRWPDAKLTGNDNVMMLDCWVYEANPPVQSNYAKVRYWISKTYLSMIRADGLNAKGEAIKRFTFNSVIEAEDTVVIGEMKVAQLTPGTDVSASRTFVQIETVEKGSGL